MTQTYEKWEVKKTCDSENTISGRDTRPARSCSMYSNTRYMLFDRREVIMPSNFMMFGWSSLRRIVISLAMNLMLSGWKLSKRTFFKANIFPVSTSRARNTLLYVPSPIYRNENIEKHVINPKWLDQILWQHDIANSVNKHTITHCHWKGLL